MHDERKLKAGCTHPNRTFSLSNEAVYIIAKNGYLNQTALTVVQYITVRFQREITASSKVAIVLQIVGRS
jgi:hypothetical protein